MFRILHFSEFGNNIHAAKVRKVPPADVQRVARQYLGVLRTVIIQPQ